MRLSERSRKKSCCRCFRPSTASIWLPDRVKNRRLVRHSKFSIHLIWFCSKQEKILCDDDTFQMVTRWVCVYTAEIISMEKNIVMWWQIPFCNHAEDWFYLITRQSKKNCRLVEHSKFSIHISSNSVIDKNIILWHFIY